MLKMLSLYFCDKQAMQTYLSRIGDDASKFPWLRCSGGHIDRWRWTTLIPIEEVNPHHQTALFQTPLFGVEELPNFDVFGHQRDATRHLIPVVERCQG